MKNRSHPARLLYSLNMLLIAGVSACLTTAGFAAGAKDPTDVTAAVAAAVKGERLSIAANNTVFGDTAPGVSKKLHVEYRVGAEKL